MKLGEIGNLDGILSKLRRLGLPEDGWEAVSADAATPWGGTALVVIKAPAGIGAIIISDDMFEELGEECLFPADEEILGNCPPEGYEVYHFINR